MSGKVRAMKEDESSEAGVEEREDCGGCWRRLLEKGLESERSCGPEVTGVQKSGQRGGG